MSANTIDKLIFFGGFVIPALIFWAWVLASLHTIYHNWLWKGIEHTCFWCGAKHHITIHGLGGLKK